jgi:hypothetical protein
MTLLLLALLAQSDPRYQGGVSPHPLSATGPVDDRSSVLACSTQTLRARSQCVLDGKPMWATDRSQQVGDNRRVATSIGESLCRENVESLDAEAREKGERLKACLARVQQAAKSCDLDGAEALLDASGLFSPHAAICYGELAGASQLALAPSAPPSPPPHPRPGAAVAGTGAEVRL